MPDLSVGLARGLARQIGNSLEERGSQARSACASCIFDVVAKTTNGRKIDGPGFNVPLVAAVQALTGNVAAIALSHRRFKLGQDGFLTAGSLKRVNVRRFPVDATNSESTEWTLSMSRLTSQRGKVAAHLWTVPCLFDNALLERSVINGERTTGRDFVAMIDDAAVLIAAFRTECVGRGSFSPCAVIVPVADGALLGGFEVVDSGEMKGRIQNCIDPKRQGMETINSRHTLLVSASVSSFAPAFGFTSAQSDAVERLREWRAANDAVVRADPLAAYSWKDAEDHRILAQTVAASFRDINVAVQAAFSDWRT